MVVNGNCDNKQNLRMLYVVFSLHYKKKLFFYLEIVNKGLIYLYARNQILCWLGNRSPNPTTFSQAFNLLYSLFFLMFIHISLLYGLNYKLLIQFYWPIEFYLLYVFHIVLYQRDKVHKKK